MTIFCTNPLSVCTEAPASKGGALGQTTHHLTFRICVSLIDKRALLEPKAQSISVLDAISKNNRPDPVRNIQIFPVKWAEPEI